MAERYLLQIEQGPNQGSRYPLSDSGGTIGRHAEATIVVGDQRASRRHARLDLNDGQVWLRDLGSANGTYLNGVQLRQPTALNPGDLITIGDTSLRFLAADDAATALNQPAPSPVALPEGETRLAHGSGTAPTRPASPGGVQVVAPGMTLNDRYALEEQVGQGGFARVYLATDLLLKRRIAVKVLSSDLAEAEGRAFLDRFALEAQSIAALDHPNILAIHDFGEAFGTVFLVMPYIEGGTLHDRLRARGQLPLTEVRDYLRQAAAALDFAHRRHLVHRDIKPQNMLLRADDNRLLLSDFGLAKVVSSTSAQSRTGVMGTIAYMAPEQFQGLVGPATDIYALGCVLFQMLTGQLPFTGPTEQVMYAHLAGPIPMLAERGGAHVPAAVQPILARALAKQPEGRYRTAGDLAAAFDAALGGATMPAPAPIPPDAEATVIGNTPPAAYHTPPFVPLGQQPTALNTPSAFAPPPPNQPPWLPPGPVFTPAAPPKRAGRRALLAAGALTGLALVGAGGGALAFAQRRDTPPPTPTTGFASGPVGSGGVAPGPSASASSAPPTPTFTPAPVSALPSANSAAAAQATATAQAQIAQSQAATATAIAQTGGAQAATATAQAQAAAGAAQAATATAQAQAVQNQAATATAQAQAAQAQAAQAQAATATAQARAQAQAQGQAATATAQARAAQAATATAQAQQAQAAQKAQAAASVVTKYYAAINSKDFTTAWSLASPKWAGSNYNNWKAGYDNTVSVTLTIVDTALDSGENYRVNVRLASQEKDGSTKRFAGYYLVGPDGGTLKMIGAEMKAA